MHPLLKNKPTVERAIDVPMNSTARIGSSTIFVCNDDGVMLLMLENNVNPVVIQPSSDDGWWVDGNYTPTSAYLSSVLNGQPDKYKLGERKGTDKVKTESVVGRYSMFTAEGRRFLFNSSENCLLEIVLCGDETCVIGVVRDGAAGVVKVHPNDPIWDLVE